MKIRIRLHVVPAKAGNSVRRSQSPVAAAAAIHLFFQLKEHFRGSENRDCGLRRNDGLGLFKHFIAAK